MFCKDIIYTLQFILGDTVFVLLLNPTQSTLFCHNSDPNLLQIVYTTTPPMACKPENLHPGCALPSWQTGARQLSPEGLWFTCWCPWACHGVRGLHLWKWPGFVSCSVPLYVCTFVAPSTTLFARSHWYSQVPHEKVSHCWISTGWRNCCCIQPVRRLGVCKFLMPWSKVHEQYVPV